VARELGMKGYNKVYALKGGWLEWFLARYPMEPK
jgi:hypothetical protein